MIKLYGQVYDYIELLVFMHSRVDPHPRCSPRSQPSPRAAHGLGSDVASCLSKSSVNPLRGYSVSFDGRSQDVTSVTTIYGLSGNEKYFFF